MPIVGAIVAYLLGDHSALHPRRLLGIAIGLGGRDAAGRRRPRRRRAPWWSVVEVLLVCVGYATAPFIATRRLADVPSSVSSPSSLPSSPSSTRPSPGSPAPTTRRRPRRGRPCSALALICTAIAFVVFFALIADVGPARATLITFVNPAVAVVVGAIVLDEQITAATVAGFALVLAGCWLSTRHAPEVIAEAPVPATLDPG